MKDIRISVLIIAYNQEHLIRRALDSVIEQRDYIYEVCVSDDCSTDGTAEVVRGYVSEYPSLVKLFVNEVNEGIFRNIENSRSRATGNLIYELSGDDAVGHGWFEKVTELVLNNDLDLNKERIGIYGDYVCVYPDGGVYRESNNLINSGLSLFKLYQRGLISNRSVCYSISVLKQFRNLSDGRSFKVENAIDCLVHVYIEKALYINYVGNLYFTRIGVSASMSSERVLEHRETMVYAFSVFSKLGVRIDKNDANLPSYNLALKDFRQHKNILNLLKVIYWYSVVFDYKVGLRDLKVKKWLFILRRAVSKRLWKKLNVSSNSGW